MILEITQLSKIFSRGKTNVSALMDIDLNVAPQDFLLIKGESGSGKSTLLFTIAGMLKPNSGKVTILGKDMVQMSEQEKTRFRATEIGFVFQSYYLIPYLNVLENIILTNHLPDIHVETEEAVQLANELGLQDRLYHKPSELSAGEKQRVALARALVTKPTLILADEPTGNLDEKNAEEVLNHLKTFQHKGGTVVMVSHGNLADKYASRIIRLDKGMIPNHN